MIAALVLAASSLASAAPPATPSPRASAWLAPARAGMAAPSAQETPASPVDNAALFVRWQAAQKLHEAGKIEEARGEMAAILAADPKNLELALAMTRWLAEVRADFTTALPSARRALELGVSKADAINLVGSVLTMCDAAVESEKVFAAGTERFPADFLMWFGLGVARGRQMKYLEAKGAFAEALRLAPENGLVLFSAGENFTNLREYEAAERSFSRSVKLKGHDDAPWRLGQVLALQGKREAAESVLAPALTQGGKSARFQAALQLSMLWVEHDRAAEALPLLTQATEERPTSREAWRWLARAQRALGRPEVAARSMKRYAELRADEDRLEEERLLSLIQAQLKGGATGE
jgi:tetratricopeptide (TPR) repeat protein